MAHAQWAVAVRSLDSGETLYELNAGKLMMPASNMKIVTLACAARVLGWDHRFVTTLEADGPIEGGALLGDLVVRGGGDPTMNQRDNRNAATFDAWAAALRTAGIDRIAGNIVGDDDAFEDEGLGSGWAWDYLQFGYAAPVGALQYNENVAELTVQPGARAGDPAIVTLDAGAGLGVLNRALTGPRGEPDTIAYRRRIDAPVLEVTGTTPLPPILFEAAQVPRTVRRQVAVVNPTSFFARSLKDALVARGIPVSGDPVDLDDVPHARQTAADERRVLARTESPTLREMAAVLMKVSHNQYAETLLRAIGAATGSAGTVRAGREGVLRVLQEWQIDSTSMILADGSGLSRYNYITASALMAVLERMYSDPIHREPFLAAMPVAGRDGTMSARLRRTRAEANAMAKTGAISNVRALSGYVRTRDGEMLVFSILANDFSIPAATVNWIADLGVEVLSNFTREFPR